MYTGMRRRLLPKIIAYTSSSVPVFQLFYAEWTTGTGYGWV